MAGKNLEDFSPFETLGVSSRVTPEQLEVAYKLCMHRLADSASGSEVERIEWAYREICLKQQAESRSDDGVVSAELLPTLGPLEIVDQSQQGLPASPWPDSSLENNVFVLARRPGATSINDVADPSALGIQEPRSSVGVAAPEVGNSFARAHPDGTLESLLAMPARGQIPSSQSVAQREADEVAVIDLGTGTVGLGMVLPRRVQASGLKRTIRSVIGEGEKEVVPVRTSQSRSVGGQHRIAQILGVYPEACGGMLAEIREAMGVSVQEMALRTKIHERHIAAIEKEDYANLPALVYFRGFLNSYLRYLGIDDSKLLDAMVIRFQDRRRV
jgi:hypothetical protein